MSEIVIPSQGILKNLDEKIYHAHHSISSSKIKEALKTPAHYYAKFVDESVEEEEKEAFRFGRLVHMALLEPAKFKLKAAIQPDWGLNKNSNAYKSKYADWLSSIPQDAVRLDERDAEKITAMLARLKSHSIIPNMMQDAVSEVSCFWVDKDEEFGPYFCRGRADLIEIDGIMIDYKTTKSADLRLFQNDAFRLWYHVQMAHYRKGFRANGVKVNEVALIVQETTYPFLPRVFYMDEFFLDLGEQHREIGIKRILKAHKTNIFEGYPEQITTLTAPYYVMYEELV